MKFDDTYFSREDRYSVGIELTSGQHYISIPVSSRVLDYEEHYAISPEQHRAFLRNRGETRPFAEACRRREHDDLLIVKPGWNRGTPTDRRHRHRDCGQIANFGDIAI